MKTWTKASTRLRSLTLALIISLSLWGSAFADFGFGGVNDFNFDFDFDFNFDFDIPSVPDVPAGGDDLYWSEYDETYLNSSQHETAEDAKKDYAKAQDDFMNAKTQAQKDAAQAAMDEAHARAEAARADSSGNYSGGKDGSEYIPLGGSGSGGNDDYFPPYVPPTIPDGSVGIGSADLTDQNGKNLSSGTIKSGYCFFADVSTSCANVSEVFVTASYNFGSGTKTLRLEKAANGNFMFPVNSESATAKRCVYIPVETKDGSYTITFTVSGTDGHGAAITATKQSTLTIKGSMFDDDFTGDR